MNIRENRGITLVVLVITVVLILIIVGITLTSFFANRDEISKISKTTELNMVQHAILERYTKYQLTKETLPGTTVNLEEVKSLIDEINSKSNENIQLKGTEYKILRKSDLRHLGIKNPKDAYIVNYKTGEVINSSIKVTEDGEALYTYAKENEN